MKKLVSPSSWLYVFLTVAGVGGFALDMTPPSLLYKGFQDLSLLLGYQTAQLLPSMCQTNAQVPQSPGPCLSYGLFLIAFHHAEKRGKHSERLSLSQGR